MNYCVEPRRRIGRPAKRWDDQIESFAQEIFHSSWFQAAKSETWSSHEKAFVQWCLECWCLVVVVSHVPRGAQLWLGRGFCVCSKCYALDCIGTCFTHVPTCDSVRVESAEQLNASVHALHMFKPATTFLWNLLRNRLVWCMPYTCPHVWLRPCWKCEARECFGRTCAWHTDFNSFVDFCRM